MPMSRTRFVLLYSMICLIWGSTWVAIRIGHNAHIPPFLAATLRFAVASLVLWAMVFFSKYPMPKGRREWRAVFANGLLGSGLSYTIVYWTRSYTGLLNMSTRVSKQ
jgi:drug/metabolite transporter (DMT)-like permease